MSKIVLYFTFFYILVQSQSLIDLPTVKNNDIAETETEVRNTLNSIFSALKLKDPPKPRWKQYIKIHDYFFSITLQDHDNLKEISRLVQVNNIDNSIQIFITQINEVLSKDNKSDETTDAVYITLLIQTFLEGLEHLKETYGVKSNVTNFDINETILKILDSDETFDNATSEYETNDTVTTLTNVTKNPEFWAPSGRRIFQGTRVSIRKFPFMASIQFFRKFQCAGSIIKSDIVITSASCLQLAYNNRFYRENPSFLAVIIGSRFYEVGKEFIPIMEIYFHPNYNPKTLKHNLALIRLLRHIRFSKVDVRVRKIDIDRRPSTLPGNTNGITIAGWGSRDSSNVLENPWKNRLSYAVLDIYPLSSCQEVYSKEYVTERNFCAGFFSKGGGACNHDAGGPGVVAGILTGVVSFGSPMCGAPDAPTVFTKVGYYAEWIDEILAQKLKRIGAPTTLRPERKITVGPKVTPKYETTQFKIDPINAEGEVVEEEVIPIQDAEGLEALEQSDLFNKFLKTIFENDFMEDGANLNLEAGSDESGLEKENETKSKTKTKTKVRTDKSKTGKSLVIDLLSDNEEEADSPLNCSTCLTTKMMDIYETNPPKYTKTDENDLPDDAKSHKRKGNKVQINNMKKVSKFVKKEKSDVKVWQNALENLLRQIKEKPKDDKNTEDAPQEGGYASYDNNESTNNNRTEHLNEDVKNGAVSHDYGEEDYASEEAKNKVPDNKEGKPSHYDYSNYEEEDGRSEDKDTGRNDDNKGREGGKKERNRKGKRKPKTTTLDPLDEDLGESGEIKYTENSDGSEGNSGMDEETDDEGSLARNMKKRYDKKQKPEKSDSKHSYSEEDDDVDDEEYEELSIEDIKQDTDTVSRDHPTAGQRLNSGIVKKDTKNKKSKGNDTEKMMKMLKTNDVFALLANVLDDKT